MHDAEGMGLGHRRTSLEYVRVGFFFSSRRRHTRYWRDWSSDVCSSDLISSPTITGTPTGSATTGTGNVVLATSPTITTPTLSGALGGNLDLGTTNATLFEIANDTTTGTAVNKLAKLTGAPSTVVIASTSDTKGIVGVVVGGAGNTGNAQIAMAGVASCVFDNATTAGDYRPNTAA